MSYKINIYSYVLIFISFFPVLPFLVISFEKNNINETNFWVYLITFYGVRTFFILLLDILEYRFKNLIFYPYVLIILSFIFSVILLNEGVQDKQLKFFYDDFHPILGAFVTVLPILYYSYFDNVLIYCDFNYYEIKDHLSQRPTVVTLSICISIFILSLSREASLIISGIILFWTFPLMLWFYQLTIKTIRYRRVATHPPNILFPNQDVNLNEERQDYYSNNKLFWSITFCLNLYPNLTYFLLFRMQKDYPLPIQYFGIFVIGFAKLYSNLFLTERPLTTYHVIIRILIVLTIMTILLVVYSWNIFPEHKLLFLNILLSLTFAKNQLMENKLLIHHWIYLNDLTIRDERKQWKFIIQRFFVLYAPEFIQTVFLYVLYSIFNDLRYIVVMVSLIFYFIIFIIYMLFLLNYF